MLKSIAQKSDEIAEPDVGVYASKGKLTRYYVSMSENQISTDLGCLSGNVHELLLPLLHLPNK